MRFVQKLTSYNEIPNCNILKKFTIIKNYTRLKMFLLIVFSYRQEIKYSNINKNKHMNLRQNQDYLQIHSHVINLLKISEYACLGKST
jgi:hypothetical protein